MDMSAVCLCSLNQGQAVNLLSQTWCEKNSVCKMGEILSNLSGSAAAVLWRKAEMGLFKAKAH